MNFAESAEMQTHLFYVNAMAKDRQITLGIRGILHYGKGLNLILSNKTHFSLVWLIQLKEFVNLDYR